MNEMACEEVPYPEMSGNDIYALFCSMGWTCPRCLPGTYVEGDAIAGNITASLSKENLFLDAATGKVRYRPPETRINHIGMIYPDMPASVPRLEIGGPSSAEIPPARDMQYRPFLHFCMMRFALVASSLWCEVRFLPDGRRPTSMHGFENGHREGDYRTLLGVTRAWTHLIVANSVGRKSVLTREDVLTGWQQYGDWCAANAERPTRVGFAAHLGVDRDTLRDTFSRENMHFPPA